MNDPVRSESEPGAGYEYSGGGTTITQAIVTDVSGMPYEEYMLDRVLRPLGMAQSSFGQPPAPELAPHLASAYGEKGEPVPGHFHLYPEQAAAGLWTTPSDLARFFLSIQLTLRGENDTVGNGSSALKSTEAAGVLSRPLVETMLTPYLNQNSALGVFIEKGAEGKPAYFQHGGSNRGFRYSSLQCW